MDYYFVVHDCYFIIPFAIAIGIVALAQIAIDNGVPVAIIIVAAAASCDNYRIGVAVVSDDSY